MPNYAKESKDDVLESAGEEKDTVFKRVRHITEVPILTRETVVFPYEKMTLQISDPGELQMLREVFEANTLFGICYRANHDRLMPAPDSIGVMAYVESIEKTSYANTHLVVIKGLIRFTIDSYLTTEKPYPKAKITYFEDEDEPYELKFVLLEETKGYLKQFIRLSKPQEHHQLLVDKLEVRYLHIISFLLWLKWKPSPEIRNLILDTRLKAQRLIMLNDHLKRSLSKIMITGKPSRN